MQFSSTCIATIEQLVSDFEETAAAATFLKEESLRLRNRKTTKAARQQQLLELTGLVHNKTSCSHGLLLE